MHMRRFMNLECNDYLMRLCLEEVTQLILIIIRYFQIASIRK